MARKLTYIESSCQVRDSVNNWPSSYMFYLNTQWIDNAWLFCANTHPEMGIKNPLQVRFKVSWSRFTALLTSTKKQEPSSMTPGATVSDSHQLPPSLRTPAATVTDCHRLPQSLTVAGCCHSHGLL